MFICGMITFIRSLVYSSACVVMLMIGGTAVYSNMQSIDGGLAVIEPAAGDEAFEGVAQALTHAEILPEILSSEAEPATPSE